MRSEGDVKVRVSLHGEGGAIAGPVDLGSAAREWQDAAATLQATRAARNATLTIEFEGPGTLWLDRVYMIDSDAMLGLWRPDVVAALNALQPGVIRFGGSTLEVFEWDKCLGNWDLRVPYVTEPWGGLDPDFVGVEEFVQLTRYVGAEPLICVHWTGKTPQDAAAEVEYFNGSADTAQGPAARAQRPRGTLSHPVLANRQRDRRREVRRLGGSVRGHNEAWRLLVRLGATELPRTDEIAIDGWVLAFTFGASLAAGVVLGFAPAIQASRTDLNLSLKEGRPGAGGRRSRFRSALVVGEVAARP